MSPERVQAVSEAVEIADDLEDRLSDLEPEFDGQQVPLEHIEEGDIVWVSGLESKGEVVSISDQSAEVQVGQFRVQTDRNKLSRVSGAPQKTIARESQPIRVVAARPVNPSMELDLRGWRVEEGMIRLERYLDDAYLTNLPFVRIIHGRGTGAMRKAVRETLRMHPLVASFRPGELSEGGDGVTVAQLAKAG